MAFVSDVQFLVRYQLNLLFFNIIQTFKLRESLLQIQNDPSHDISSIRFCKDPQSRAARSASLTKAGISPIIKVKDIGLRDNLYKATEPSVRR